MHRPAAVRQHDTVHPGSVGRARLGLAAVRALRPASCIALAALTLVGGPIAPACGAELPGRPAVLVLNSYHWGFAWTDVQVAGIMAVLRGSDLEPEVFIENMDVLRQPVPYADDVLLDYLKRRFRSQRVDLVMTTDDAALAFAVRHHGELFPGTPVVFSDAAEVDVEKVSPEISLTGVKERLDARATLELARQLRPNAAQIVVFANRDDTSSGARHARDVLSSLKSDMPVRILEDLKLEEIVATAASLSPRDIVFPLAFAHDRRGVWRSHSEVIASIGAASPAPIFDITSHRVHSGLTLGGRVEDGSEGGRMAARMALRVLRGENARAIRVEEGPLAYLFNHTQLQRHGIAESQLPEGSIVVGRPPSLYEQYRAAVWGTVAAMLSMGLAIVLLATAIRRRRRAEASLRASNTLLDAISRTQSLFISGAATQAVFENMLDALLAVTESEYGFIGEVLHDADAAPYLRTHAITNIAWNEETRAFYAQHAPRGLEFRNLKTLFGAVVTSAQAVISNDPASDPRRQGTPPGHPPLRSFMGLPFFRGDELVGMVGVANREVGYRQEMAATLEPFLNNCASLTHAVQESRRRSRAEEALRHNEERLRLALVAGNLGFYDLDLRTGKAEVSAEYARMLGFEPGEMNLDAAGWIARLHPEDRVLAEGMLRECAEGNRSDYRMEYRLQAKPGSWTWILSIGKVVARDEHGRPARMLGTHADITARKRSEESLELMRLSMEHASDAIFWLNQDGSLAYVNEQACRSLGYEREELLRLRLWQIDPDFPEATWHEAWPRLVDTGSFHAETRHRRKDGSVFPVEVSAKFITHAGRTYNFAFARDISGRKRSEAAVRRSEERLRQAISISGIGIFDHDHRTDTIYWSPEVRRMHGWGTDDAIDVAAFLEFVHPDDRDAIGAAIRRAHDPTGDGRFDAEYRIVRADGELRWLAAKSQTLFESDGEAQQPARTAGAVLDLTERKRAEKAIEAYAHEMQWLMKSMANAFVIFQSVLDRDGHYVDFRFDYFNDAYARVSALKLEEVRGKSILEVWPDTEKGWFDVYGEVAASGIPKTFEMYHAPTRGMYACNAYRPWPTPDRICVVFEDITERKQAEDALKALNATLDARVKQEVARNREKDHLLIQQSRLAAMGEMIGNIAHQWRQPINALALLLMNLKDAQQFGEMSDEYLASQIGRGDQLIRKMSTTIDDFRNFFRPNRDKQAFLLSVAVHDALSIIESAYEQHHIEIAVSIRNDASVLGFPNEYTQVLLNLLSNAKEAIEARKAARGRVEILVDCDGREARLTVSDNGGGIAPDVLPKIFDPYFTTRDGGTGIGLYMSKMIIETNMKGGIEARNTTDGAEFFVVTPVLRTEPRDVYPTLAGT